MSNYKRSTRECTFVELQPGLLQAMRAYFTEHAMAGIESQILMCCETISERKKSGKLAALLGENSEQVYRLAAFVTPEWLVWARSGETTNTRVAAANLKNVRVRQLDSLLFKENGIEIEGFLDGSFTKVHGSIALGPEPSADRFWNAVREAAEAINPPRRLMDLFGKVPK